MFLFIIKRLLYIILTIPVVVLIGLLVINASPVDQVVQMMDQGEFTLDQAQYDQVYEKTARLHQLDLPLFYLSVSKRNVHDRYYHEVLPDKKRFFRTLIQENVEYGHIEQFYAELQRDARDVSIADRSFYQDILHTESYNEIERKILESEDKLNSKMKFAELDRSKSIWNAIIPKIHYHGFQNRYHLSLKRIFTGDWGVSARDGQEVKSKIFQRLFLTLLMAGMAFILCYPFGIWFGKQMVIHENKRWPHIVENILFLFTSIPLFWFATLALVFFTTPEYSRFFDIFPNVSNFDLSLRNGFWKGVFSNISQLILPVLCIVILEVSIVSRQMFMLLKKEQRAPYSMTAKMKGLSRKEVIVEHQQKGTRTQMLIMMTNGLISAMSGLLIIEYIFNIPGLGRLLFDSVQYSDWPVILGILVVFYILIGIVVMISDVISQKLDPRLKFFDYAN